MAKPRAPTVKLSATRRRKPVAVARVIRPVLDRGVPLEDVLVALEKSLARATRHSVETSRAEVGFGLGERALYAIDALNIQLKVGCSAARGPDGTLSHVLVDFGGRPPETQSLVEFRIQARPLEALKGSQLILADMDALGHARPQYRLRGTLLLEPPQPPIVRAAMAVPGEGEPGAPQPEPPAAAMPPLEVVEAPAGRKLHPQADLEVEVRIVGGDTHKVDSFKATTNAVGQFEFTIDARDNRVEHANRRGTLLNVDLKQKDDDFFVFAIYAPEGDSDQAVVSNIIHLDVKREQTGPAAAPGEA
jgi:hypothetical protein